MTILVMLPRPTHMYIVPKIGEFPTKTCNIKGWLESFFVSPPPFHRNRAFVGYTRIRFEFRASEEPA